MSLRAITWAKKLPIRPPTKKFVLECLCDYATDTLLSYPKMETLQADTGMTEAQIIFAIQGLIDDRIIKDTGKRVGDDKSIRVFQIMPLNQTPKLNGRKKTTPPELQEAEQIYKIYPRPVAKPKSLLAIARCIKEFGFDYVRERTLLFAKAKLNVEIILIPHSTTFFNQQRFNDDPKTWGITGGKGTISLGPTFIQVKEYVTQHVGKDQLGWASSFYSHWNNPRINWQKNGKLIDWQEALSKQLAIWRAALPTT